jgi:hypothetical protein
MESLTCLSIILQSNHDYYTLKPFSSLIINFVKTHTILNNINNIWKESYL